MNKPAASRFVDSLHIILVIAGKDIVDALKNRLIISLIMMSSVLLLFPKLLPLIFESPDPVVPVYGEGAADLIAQIPEDGEITFLNVGSEEDFAQVLCQANNPQIGLFIAGDFVNEIDAAGALELQGEVCWNRRTQMDALQVEIEEDLSQSLGRLVSIQLEGNYVYPSGDGILDFGLGTINAVIVVILIGIVLVPNLLFEEKQSKTIHALLVSPARIDQIVAGKALAGLFYILATAVVVFTISWADVVHWELTVAFAFLAGLFSVAVGLVLGSFFEKPQDVVGLTVLLVIVMIGAIFVQMMALDLPGFLKNILPWVPSVALAELFRGSFLEQIPNDLVIKNILGVVAFSLPLYVLVIWKVSRSDR